MHTYMYFTCTHTPHTHMQAVVQMGDTNEDGLLDFSEFAKYCTEHEKKLWLVFQNLDTNQDGTVLIRTIS